MYKIYKLIIVEDEEPMREALCNLIPWNTIGFEVTAAFENATEVMQYLQQYSCDVVLTDIVMSGGDGLMLAKWIKEKSLNIKVMILSGYSDFEYAQMAIQYGVRHYFVKPVDELEMMNTFRELKDSLDAERQENTRLSSLQSFSLAFIKLLFSGKFRSREEMAEGLKLIDVPVDCMKRPMGFCCLELSVNHMSETKINNYILNISNILEMYTVSESKEYKYNLLAVNKEIYITVFCLKNVSVEDLRRHVQNKVTVISNRVKADCMGELKVLKQQYISRMDYLLANDMQQYESEQYIDDENSLFFLKYYRQLTVSIETKDITSLKNVFLKIYEETSEYSDEKFSLIINNLVCATFIRFSSNSFGTNALEQEIPWCDLTTMSKKEYLNSIYLVLSDFCSSDDSCNNDKYPIVKRVKEFISNNLSEDLSLSSLSDAVKINPSYLSRLFKQVEGETISKYILRKRMEKAIELMKHSDKIQDILSQIGFQSPSYFAFVFKKHTGYTPSEFADIIKENKQ